MGTIAIIRAFVFMVFSNDKGENRKHLHVFKKNKGTRADCLAKIWIEKNGEKDISIAYNNGLSSKDIKHLIAFIDTNYDKINTLIDRVFAGEKIDIINKK